MDINEKIIKDLKERLEEEISVKKGEVIINQELICGQVMCFIKTKPIKKVPHILRRHITLTIMPIYLSDMLRENLNLTSNQKQDLLMLEL